MPLQNVPVPLLFSNMDAVIDSPDYKISRKDLHFINTMLKINESVDQNLLKSSLEKAEKEPPSICLKHHKKNLILNASSLPPYDEHGLGPKDFLLQFLSKKSKEMLSHRLSLDIVLFHPNTQMVSFLWIGDFFWLKPDFPFGVSIFFCPELSTVNLVELEK